MGDGIGKAIAAGLWLMFFLGMLACAALYGLAKLGLYLFHHLHWVST